MKSYLLQNMLKIDYDWKGILIFSYSLALLLDLYGLALLKYNIQTTFFLSHSSHWSPVKLLEMLFSSMPCPKKLVLR